MILIGQFHHYEFGVVQSWTMQHNGLRVSDMRSVRAAHVQ